MTLPRIGTNPQAERGVAAVTNAVFKPQERDGLGHIFRRLSEVDVGIDGQIEIVEGEHPTGRIVGVQVKAGPSWFSSPSPAGWTVYIEQSTVHYWRVYAVPVLLCVVDLETETVYWTRTDVGVFDATQQKYKIPLPRHQQLNAAAATLIAQIAKAAPPSFLSQLAIPPALVLRESEVRAAIGEGNIAEYLDIAATTADDMWAAGFREHATWLVRDIVRALTHRGEPESILPLLTKWFDRVLDELENPENALRLLEVINQPRSATTPGWSTTLRGRALMQARVMQARAEAAMGLTDQANSVIQDITAETDLRQDPAFAIPAAELAGLVCMADEQFREAAEAYERLAAILETTPGGTTGGLRASNRALFARGLAGDYEAAITGLQAAQAGDEIFVLMALSWLFAGKGELQAAAATAMRLPIHPTASLDSYAVLRAYRMAGWCDRHAFVFRQPEAYDSVAHRLELLVLAQSSRGSLHERLRDRSDEAARHGKSREAMLTANHARVAALTRADLAAYSDANERMAAAWRAAVLEEPRPDHVLNALRYTAATSHVELKTPEERMFVKVVTDLLVGDTSRDALEAIAQATENDLGSIGALRLVAAFGDRWVYAERDMDLSKLVRSALASPTTDLSVSWLMDATRKALNAIRPELGPEAAAAVRDALLEFMPRVVEGNALRDALGALAVATHAAQSPADGGQAIAEYLLSLERPSARSHATHEWLSALAFSARRFHGEARRRLIDAIIAVARPQAHEDSYRWDAVMMLRAADKDPGELDASGPAAVAAAYFAMLEELLRASIAEVGGQSFSFRRADWPVLTDWAAPYADSAQRVRVGTLAAELLGENRHLLQMRLQWIPFIARVGQVTPEFAGRALQVLRAAARGALHGIGGMDEFMDPLSMFRNLGHTPDRVQSIAVAWTALLLRSSEPTVVSEAMALLEEASLSPSLHVRHAVAKGLRWALQGGGEQEMSNERRTAVDALLRRLATDHVPDVAVTALRALARVFDGQDDDTD
jgi:hypothetical protein